MSDRWYQVTQKIRPAMLALRDAEDWARLDLGDELLAIRIREIHLALSRDVLNGRAYEHSSWWKARLFDRYCLWRGKSPDAGAITRATHLRRLHTPAGGTAVREDGKS